MPFGSLTLGLGLGTGSLAIPAPSPSPTLNALTGTFSLAENATAGTSAGGLSGMTAGSTLSLVDDAGGRVALSGSSIVAGLTGLDYETATSHSFTVRETLAGATNTPHDTVLSLTVTDVAEGGSTYSFDATTAGFGFDSTSFPSFDKAS